MAIFAQRIFMSKILLTGGAGYIGSHIAVVLADHGFEAVIADNYSNSSRWIPERIARLSGKKITAYDVDCRDLSSLQEIVKKEGQISGVIHLAAVKAVGESVSNPLKYYDNNIGCMTSALQLMETTGIRHLVFSSSCTVYGSCQTEEVFEQTPWARAYSPYGYSKQVCERMMEDLALVKNNWKQVSLRYFNPIGAHPSGILGELPIGPPNNIVPYITQTAAGIRERLTIFGDDYDTPDGTCVRDYIHVMDVAEAHVKALKYILQEHAPAIDQFNIGTGEGVSVKKLVHFFETSTGVKVPQIAGPRRPGDADAIYANVSKAKRILGWKSHYSVQEALSHAWQWEQNLKT